LEAKIKGNTVRISPKFPLPSGYARIGTVIADTELVVAVKFEGQDVPVLIRKPYAATVATPIAETRP
jgi:hypothetical protein